MGASKRRAAERAGRPAMRSPGRPPVGRREHRQRFWVAIARGCSSEDAGVAAGVSPAVGSRWFHEGGGMPTVSRGQPLDATITWMAANAERGRLLLDQLGGAAGDGQLGLQLSDPTAGGRQFLFLGLLSPGVRPLSMRSWRRQV
jgi:hypothetical protein